MRVVRHATALGLGVLLATGCGQPAARSTSQANAGGSVNRAIQLPWSPTAAPQSAQLLTCVAPPQPMNPLGLCSNGACWESASPTGAFLTSAWAAAPADFWAGGLDTLLHWNGSMWQLTSLPEAVLSLWGSSATDVWAVRSSGAWHWDGSNWQLAFAHSTLTEISGTSPKDVWAAGTDGVWHWNGTAWALAFAQTTTNMSPPSIWATAASDVWAVLNGQVFHWDGASWSAQDPHLQFWSDGPHGKQLTPATYQWVRGTGPAVWVRGDCGTLGIHTGTGWMAVTPFSTGDVPSCASDAQELFDPTTVGGTSPTDAWLALATTHITGPMSDYTTFSLAHFNGTHIDRSTDTSQHLHVITGTGSSGLWAVGEGGATYRLDGSRWTSQTTTELPEDTTSLWSDDCGTILAVTSRQAPYPNNQSRFSTVWRRDTAGWVQELPSPGTSWLMDSLTLGGAPGDEPWAVGPMGFIARRMNGSWQTLPPVTNRSLNSVWGDTPDDAWAVGDSGTTLHWNGQQWQPLPLGTPYALALVTGSRANDVWTTDHLNLLHFEGTGWSNVTPPAQGFIEDLWAAAPGDLWVVENATASNDPHQLWRGNGTSWTPVNVPLSPIDFLYRIRARGTNDVWLAGKEGGNVKLFHYDGSQWSATPENIPFLGTVVSDLLLLPSGQKLLADQDLYLLK